MRSVLLVYLVHENLWFVCGIPMKFNNDGLVNLFDKTELMSERFPLTDEESKQINRMHFFCIISRRNFFEISIFLESPATDLSYYLSILRYKDTQKSGRCGDEVD